MSSMSDLAIRYDEIKATRPTIGQLKAVIKTTTDLDELYVLESIMQELVDEQPANMGTDHLANGWTIIGVAGDKRPIGSWRVGGWNRISPTSSHKKVSSKSAGVGIVTGPSGLVIIDLDTPQAMSEWVERFGAITTRTAHTPRGLHIYYTSPDASNLKPRTNVLPNIDVRAGESYVVAPGSTLDGGTYAWGNDNPIEALPAEVLRLIR